MTINELTNQEIQNNKLVKPDQDKNKDLFDKNIKSDVDYSPELVDVFNRLKNASYSHIKLRKEYLLTPKSDFTRKDTMRKQLLNLKYEIASFENEFQRLLKIEEDNYNEEV
jgi:hypothetical protein